MDLVNVLLDHAKPAVEVLRTSGRVDAARLETLMAISARHVEAAYLGVELFQEPRSVDSVVSTAAVETAGLVVVFGSSMASIDLCASSLLRWLHREPTKGQEHSLKGLLRWLDEGKVFVPTAFDDWLDQVRSDKASLLAEFRHDVVHQVLRQSVEVQIAVGNRKAIQREGDEDWYQPDPFPPFAEVCWLLFWGAFAEAS